MRFLVSFLVCMLAIPAVMMAAIPEKPTINSYVYDKADVIADNVEQQLIQAAKALESSTGNVVVMMTIDTTGDLQPKEYSEKVMRQWGIGDANFKNGLLILVTPNDRVGEGDIWISVGEGLQETYPAGLLQSMIDTYMIPYIEKGDYTDAYANIFRTFYEEMGGDVSNLELIKPINDDDSDSGLVTAILIFCLIIYLSQSHFGGGGPGGRRRIARDFYQKDGFPKSGFGGSGKKRD